jgi:hypothetical protein
MPALSDYLSDGEIDLIVAYLFRFQPTCSRDSEAPDLLLMSSSAALAIFAILALLLAVAFIFAAIHIGRKASAGR